MITQISSFFQKRTDINWVWLLGLSAVLLALRATYLLLWTPYGLAPDEAQYWHWLSHPALAYTTKPALTTWVMGLSTAVLGDTILGVKLFALLGQIAVPLLGFAMVRKVTADVRLAWLGWAVLTTAPIVAAGGLVMAPDALLLPLWLGALYLVIQQVQARNLSIFVWVGIGVLVGLAGLAKYSAGAFYVLLALYGLICNRNLLKSKAFYLSGLVALAMQFPTIYWNFTHEWEGIKHVLWQTNGGGDDRHGGLASLGDFVISQLAVWGLLGGSLCVVGLSLGVVRGQLAKNEGAKVLFWMSVPIVLGFILQTTGAKVQANWPILGMVGLVILGVCLLKPLPASQWLKRWLWVGPLMAVSVVLSVALYDTPELHKLGLLKIKQDPTKELLGYKELGYVTGLKLDTLASPKVLLTTRYQTTAALAFHDERKVPVLYVNPGHKRANEYDLWDWPSLKDTLVLYVNEQRDLPAAVATRFNNCQPYGSVSVEVHGQKYREAWYWVCWEDRFATGIRDQESGIR